MNIYKGIMDISLLTRQNRSTRPQIAPFQTQNLDIRLDLGRVHECAGRARRSFALMLAAQLSGPILWITPQYETQRPNPDGIQPFWIRPGCFLPHRSGQWTACGVWKKPCAAVLSLWWLQI